MKIQIRNVIRSLAVLMCCVVSGVGLAEGMGYGHLEGVETVHTLGGVLTIVDNPSDKAGDPKTVYLNGKSIPNTDLDGFRITFSYKAAIGGNDVVVINFDDSGASTCNSSYIFITITPQGKATTGKMSADACEAKIEATSSAITITSIDHDDPKLTTTTKTIYTKDGITQNTTTEKLRSTDLVCTEAPVSQQSRNIGVSGHPNKIALTNLATYNGGRPKKAQADSEISKMLCGIVPQSSLNCLNDLFDNMQDIQLTANGSIQSDASGSHADNFHKAFFSASPGGNVDVVLSCEGEPYQYFTNRLPSEPAPKSLLDWVEQLNVRAYWVKRFDHNTNYDFMFSHAEIKKVNLAITPAMTPSTTEASTLSQRKKSNISIIQIDGGWQCAGNQHWNFNKNSQYTYQRFGDSYGANKIEERSGRYGIDDPNDVENPEQFIELYGVGGFPTPVGFSIKDSDHISLMGEKWSSDCTSAKADWQAKVAAAAAKPKHESGDTVSAYVNNIASELERSSYPACRIIADNIRRIGSSGAPDYIRKHQVDGLVDRAPAICVQ